MHLVDIIHNAQSVFAMCISTMESVQCSAVQCRCVNISIILIEWSDAEKGAEIDYNIAQGTELHCTALHCTNQRWASRAELTLGAALATLELGLSCFDALVHIVQCSAVQCSVVFNTATTAMLSTLLFTTLLIHSTIQYKTIRKDGYWFLRLDWCPQGGF
jgi:hypothetical protein